MFITADRRCLAAITPTDPRHYFLTSWLHAALQNQMAFLLRAFVAICSVEKNLILNNFSLQLQRKYAQTNNNKQNKTISARKQHPICLWLLQPNEFFTFYRSNGVTESNELLSQGHSEHTMVSLYHRVYLYCTEGGKQYIGPSEHHTLIVVA